jgi:cytochrome b
VTTAALVTGLQGGNLMVWHGRLGVSLGGPPAFRLAWGVVASTDACFGHFVRGPDTIRAYLRTPAKRRSSETFTANIEAIADMAQANNVAIERTVKAARELETLAAQLQASVSRLRA